MKPIYKITFFLLLIPAILFANTNPKKKHEKSKTIKKEFNVNSDATLDISNKYGNITVTTWNENRVEIDVKITVKGNNLDNVEDRLNSIKIEFDATKNLVEARTILGSQKSSWSSWWGKSSNMSYQINYVVKMPRTNNVDFSNKYGNIILGELEGEANISCDYGKILIEELHNKNNTIDLDYCSQSTINYMNSGDVSIDYSKLSIEKTNKIKTNADYSNIHIGEADIVDFNSDYGNITIDEANDINGNSDYASMKLGTVNKNLTIDTDYGGLRVKNLAKGFEKVTIDGSYAGIKIGTSSTNNFDFTIDLGYASFSYPDEKINMRKSIKKTSKKYYEGSFGKGSNSSKIHIKSGYGGVSLKLND